MHLSTIQCDQCDGFYHMHKVVIWLQVQHFLIMSLFYQIQSQFQFLGNLNYPFHCLTLPQFLCVRCGSSIHVENMHE